MCDPSLHGHIGECAVAIVSKQMGNRLAAGRKPFEPRSVHQKNIQPAIVVVVVERNSAARGFEQIFVLVLAAKNSFRIEAGFAADVEKADSEITACRRLLRRRCRSFLSSSRKPARTRQGEHILERKDERGTAE